MSAANGTQRDIGLDLTRILAFLAVPSVHFFLNSTYYDTAIVGPRMALMTVMRTAFMVCVPLYMLLSGYLSAEKHIPLTRPGLLGYYKKLLPIFLTYALSTGVILLYRVLWLGEEQTIRSAVKNLLSFQQYSWYMNMYFGLLLLTPFLNALWQSLATPAARRALLAVLLVLTVLPGMVNIYNLHSAETLLHPWLSTSYDQLVPDWWQAIIFPVFVDGCPHEIYHTYTRNFYRILETQEQTFTATVFRRQLQQVLPIERYFTFCYFKGRISHQDTTQCTFSRSIRSHDSMDFSSLYRKVYTFQYLFAIHIGM